MKKILIWDTMELKDTGGPSGYLFNIHEYLKEVPNSQIFFLSDLTRPSKGNKQHFDVKKKSLLNFFCQLIPRSVKNAAPILVLKKIIDNILYLHLILWKQFQINTIKISSSINLNEFDFIHFHFIPDLLRFKKNFSYYKGKKILTSHCPCPWTDETLSHEKKWVKFFRPIMIHHEINCYKYADYLMFPCKEAREPYEKEPRIKRLFHTNEFKFFYIPTGILKSPKQVFQTVSLDKWGIGENDFVIGFFGRHEVIKGYDILKDIAKDLLKQFDNLFFLCAGTGDIKPLQHSHWIELGFISNVQSYISKCDLYIQSNRQTYFDLITLELLRAGVITLLSDNGGNRFFKSFPSKDTIGISFFSPYDKTSIAKQVKSFIEEKNKHPDLHKQRKKANQLLFFNNFSVNHFITKYTTALQSMS